ncbi:hypothetical protein [Streptomyces nitrosporeus]|uniref:hypothetical protein n=1 Tax=Streptomyces nitrosporeus TaxID=28894 RepID=UPI003334384A
MSRKKDGSIHLRRRGTVIFGWLVMAVISPVMVLAGLAEVEGKGFRGIPILLLIGGFDAMIVRVGIRSRLILSRDGFVWDVGPLFVTYIPNRDILSVACEGNGLLINLPGGAHGVWSFSQSLMGAGLLAKPV